MANDENPTNLRKRRGIIQASCTCIKAFVDAITQFTPSVMAQLVERRAKLDRYWSDYEAVQTRLELLDENEANHRPGFEEAFYLLTGKIREVLHPPSQQRSANAPSPAPSSSGASDTPESLAHVHLPKLNLPTFSGRYDEGSHFLIRFSPSFILTRHSRTYKNYSTSRPQ